MIAPEAQGFRWHRPVNPLPCRPAGPGPLHTRSTLVRRWGLIPSALIVVPFAWLSGCSSPQKPEPAPAPAALRHTTTKQEKSSQEAKSAIAAAKEPAHQPYAQSPAPITPLGDRESPCTSLRKLLPKSCVVVEATPTTLLVKSGTPTDPPSLFEEAITLSKLRGLLSAKPSIPKETAQKTKLQNGTATIPFGKSVSSADAASAVETAFSVEGVQRVRAVLNAN